jgi:hypothetical protein
MYFKKHWIVKAKSIADANGWDHKAVAVVNEHHSFEVKALDDDDNDTRQGVAIKGFLSTFKNVDRDGDIVMEGAFDKAVAQLNKSGGTLPLLFDHINMTTSQAGAFESLKITAKGLLFKAFISETPNTIHQLTLIKNGQLKTTSMGGIFKFAQNTDNSLRKNDKGQFFIETVDLFEGSIVAIPANPKALFTMKSLDELIKNIDRETLEIGSLNKIENPKEISQPIENIGKLAENPKEVPMTSREKYLKTLEVA